jgi:hypothetical protein
MIQCIDIYEMSSNIRRSRVTLSRISMRKPEVTLCHFMIQCIEIQQRSANVGGPGVPYVQYLWGDQKSPKSFHDTMYGDSTNVIQCSWTRGHLTKNIYKKTTDYLNSFHDTVYEDSTKVSQCNGTRGHIMFNTHEETRGSLKSFHDTVCGDSTKVTQCTRTRVTIRKY